MASEHTNRKIPRPASRPLETLTKIAALTLDGYLFMAYLPSRTVVQRLCARVANVRIGERGVLDESPEGFFDQAETDFRKLFCM